ncbi:protein ILRUN [Prorops nasuta]|uniref:protein ILRUN n=1 Tax=Prorops nasuta TaxID=863751 RepID=UPI0034CEEC57
MDMDNELDQHLLQQFSCLGTMDKDDLVNELRRLLGDSINVPTATFFLDMNNWNLQAAICSYFDCDYHIPSKGPSMTLICDSTIGEGESVPPNTKFRKSWKVRNNGITTWPSNINLKQVWGLPMEDGNKVYIPSLAPKETTEITLVLKSPAECGFYQNKWRMMTFSGALFGDVLRMDITVHESGTLAVTQQFHQLSTSQPNDDPM